MPPLRKRPRIQNLALTDIGAEFQLELPPRVKSITWQAMGPSQTPPLRQSVAVMMAAIEGGTLLGPYFTMAAGTILWEDSELEMTQDVILYFRDPINVDTVIEALIWEEDR